MPERGDCPLCGAARASMEKKGLRPYYIYGDDRGQGNAHTAMEAYVQVYREIRRQERRLNLHFDLIFLASSTNTTQAGLLAGADTLRGSAADCGNLRFQERGQRPPGD